MARILIVDEQAMVRELIGEVLSLRGHEIVTSSTRAEALAFVGENHVDLLLAGDVEAGADARGEGAPIGDFVHAARARGASVVLLDQGPGHAPEACDSSDEHPVCSVGRARFRLDDLLMRVDECLGLHRLPERERRGMARASSVGQELRVHVNGMGPWRVIDVSPGGLGIVAGVRFEPGQVVRILLRDGRLLFGGPMRISHREGRGGGKYRYGLRIEERSSVLGRGLTGVCARLVESKRSPGMNRRGGFECQMAV